MTGKEKCKFLREIRQRIASENDIPFVTQACTFQGDCKGTCPKCEAELHFLENELAKSGRWKKMASMAGLTLALSACHEEMGDVYIEPDPEFEQEITDSTANSSQMVKTDLLFNDQNNE